MIGKEIKSRESFFLLFKIFIKGFLTCFDWLIHSVKTFVSFVSTSIDDLGTDWCINHEFPKFSINTFENFGFFSKLLFDIGWFHKNINQKFPIFLNFKPFVDNRVDSSEFFSPIFYSIDKEFNIFSLRFHSHKIHWILIKKFHHVI